MTRPLLTIGYGNRSADEFVALLKRHGVVTLVDIRTTPFSRFRPQFSKKALSGILERAGVAYVFMGETLGGRPEDQTCYTGGKVDYAKVRRRAWFKRGIEELGALHRRTSGNLVIMCAELKPEECHRSRLVGAALDSRGVEVLHIDARGELQDHPSVVGLFGGGD